MKSFNGAELKVGQRVITYEDDEAPSGFTYAIIRGIEEHGEHTLVNLDVPCDDYGRTREPSDLIVLPEDNV